MTNEQLYQAIGIPMLFNAAMMGLLIAHINARFTTPNGMSTSASTPSTSASTICEISGARNSIAWKRFSMPG